MLAIPIASDCVFRRTVGVSLTVRRSTTVELATQISCQRQTRLRLNIPRQVLIEQHLPTLRNPQVPADVSGPRRAGPGQVGPCST